MIEIGSKEVNVRVAGMQFWSPDIKLVSPNSNLGEVKRYGVGIHCRSKLCTLNNYDLFCN